MSLQRIKKQDQLNTRDKQRSPGTYVMGENWLDHSKACAIVDQMLLTGADMSALITSGRKKKSVENHINHLRTEHGLTVDKYDGVYRFGYVNRPTIENTYKKNTPSLIQRIHTESKPASIRQEEKIVASTMISEQIAGSGMLKTLFQEMENIIQEEVAHNVNEDLQRQFEIIASRHFDTVTDEPGILNNLIIQASSYSVMRNTFNVRYPDDIWKFDKHYGTTFFSHEEAPQYSYENWEDIVLTWGGILLSETGINHASDLETLVKNLRRAHASDWQSYARQPRSRIVLSLATALPKVRREILPDSVGFLKRLDQISKNHPGHAYDCAKNFSKGIIQMDSSLVCNFFKELGLLYYVKVDVHVAGFMKNITLQCKVKKKKAFILSWLLAQEAEIKPFFLDKLIYVGRKFSSSELHSVLDAYRNTYEKEVNRLIEEISTFE